jgi:hypothetical protein
MPIKRAGIISSIGRNDKSVYGLGKTQLEGRHMHRVGYWDFKLTRAAGSTELHRSALTTYYLPV